MLEEDKLKIQYLGESGYTQTCLFAIGAILNSGSLPDRATIVSHKYNRQSLQEEHLFLFWNWGHSPLTVVSSGFSSGYPGEGPKGFSLTICMVRSKGIPLDGISISKLAFKAIDNGQIDKIEHPYYQKIKAKSEPLTFPWSLWVLDEDEKLLGRGQLWKKFYWYNQPKCDLITKTIADVDLYCPEVGKKLKMAIDKVENSEEIAEWQNATMLIRDAWIELTQWLCQVKNVDISDVTPDAVINRLKKLGIDKTDEKLFNLARASFNLYSKHHKRDISNDTATACVISTIVSMQTVIKEVF